MTVRNPTYQPIQNNMRSSRHWWRRLAATNAGLITGDIDLIRLAPDNQESLVLDFLLISTRSADAAVVEIGAFDGVNFTPIMSPIGIPQGGETYAHFGGMLYADDQHALNLPIIPGVALAMRTTVIVPGDTVDNITVLCGGHFERLSNSKLRNLNYIGG